MAAELADVRIVEALESLAHATVCVDVTAVDADRHALEGVEVRPGDTPTIATGSTRRVVAQGARGGVTGAVGRLEIAHAAERVDVAIVEVDAGVTVRGFGLAPANKKLR